MIALLRIVTSKASELLIPAFQRLTHRQQSAHVIHECHLLHSAGMRVQVSQHLCVHTSRMSSHTLDRLGRTRGHTEQIGV